MVKVERKGRKMSRVGVRKSLTRKRRRSRNIHQLPIQRTSCGESNRKGWGGGGGGVEDQVMIFFWRNRGPVSLIIFLLRERGKKGRKMWGKRIWAYPSESFLSPICSDGAERKKEKEEGGKVK